MEFLQHQGNWGVSEKDYLSEVPGFLYDKRWFVVEAVLCNFVCLLWLPLTCGSKSLSITTVGIHVRAALLGASCSLTYCHLALGKHFHGGLLVTVQQQKAK